MASTPTLTKEQQWTVWWAERTKLVNDDGTRTAWEKQQAVIREKKNWWYYTFGEPYWTVEDKELHDGFCMTVAQGDAVLEKLGRPLMKNPVLFGCPSCDKLFPNRHGCDTHIKTTHGTGQATVLFHPQATELELKACLFVNMPWQDRAMLSETLRSSDMDLCYVTKKLVLREPEESEHPYDY